MRLIQTDLRFSLDSVKPLDPLIQYRDKAVALARDAVRKGRRWRPDSPVTGRPLDPLGEVEGFSYGRCRETGSWFLSTLSNPESWAELLAGVNRLRHGPESFHLGLAQSRTDHVYAPKMEWIEDTLRFQGLHKPRILEAATPPSPFTTLLQESPNFSEVQSADEMRLAHGASPGPDGQFQAAVLLESLDRVDEPRALLETVRRRLADPGLLFVTGLVCSGFDFSVLGLKNLYLYPPDRTNVFSLKGLSDLLTRSGFQLVEVSTPGVLDLEVVQAHCRRDPALNVSVFENQLLSAEEETRLSFQDFLQQQRLSSFARIVARKTA